MSELEIQTFGARVKKLFLAFLLSNFIGPVAIWLALEYLKLAKLLESTSATTKNEMQKSALARAAQTFRTTAILSFIGMIAGVVISIIVSTVSMSPLMSLMRGSSPSTSFLFSMVGTVIACVCVGIATLVLGIIQINMNKNAWLSMDMAFKAETVGNAKTYAPMEIARIIKGISLSMVALILAAPLLAIAAILVGLLPTFIMTGPAVLVGFIILGIASLGISVAMGILSLVGMINHAVGLFNLGKQLQADTAGMVLFGASIQGSPISSGVQPSVPVSEPIAAPAVAPRALPAFCPQCNNKLPPDPSIQFCPACGYHF